MLEKPKEAMAFRKKRANFKSLSKIGSSVGSTWKGKEAGIKDYSNPQREGLNPVC